MKVLDDMLDAWAQQPICTSVVIIFWQMYLWRLATAHGDNPADIILKFMPLRADRVLPGQLLKTMREHGFVALSLMPKVFESVVVSREHQPGPVLCSPQPGQQQLPEPPFTMREHVLYWSESMSQWIDAVVLSIHLDSQGAVVAVDLDVRSMADVAKIRRWPQAPSEEQRPAPKDSASRPVSSRRPTQLIPPLPQDALKENFARTCDNVAALKENVSQPAQNVAALSAAITAALDEGWFSAEDVESALLASLSKCSSNRAEGKSVLELLKTKQSSSKPDHVLLTEDVPAPHFC